MQRPPTRKPRRVELPTIDVAPAKPKRPYWLRRGWKDAIFLCVVIVLGWVAKRYLFVPELTDYAKWQNRPHLVRHISLKPVAQGETGLPPCLLIGPSKTKNQPVASATIADCLQLVPDGRPYNLYEVNLLRSVLLPVKTDLFLGGAMPIAFTRTYFPLYDWSERFQIFLPNVYNLFLTGHRYPYTDIDWSLPDNQIVHFDRVSSGTGYADAVFEHASSDPVFAFARQNWNGFGWDLALPSGATLLSPEAYNSTRPQQGSLVGIFDPQGREIRLTRQPNGDLTQIDSPDGQWMKLSYDSGRIVQVADSSGRRVSYGYDDGNRLATAVYSTGGSMAYSYDSTNRLIQSQDLASGLNIEAHYDSADLLDQLDIGEGRRFQLRYTVDQPEKLLNIDVTDPSGAAQRVSVHIEEGRSRYTVTPIEPRAAAPSGAATDASSPIR